MPLWAAHFTYLGKVLGEGGATFFPDPDAVLCARCHGGGHLLTRHPAALRASPVDTR